MYVTSNDIPFELMSGFIFSTDQSAMGILSKSLVVYFVKTEYIPRAVVRLINIFNCCCLAYD